MVTYQQLKDTDLATRLQEIGREWSALSKRLGIRADALHRQTQGLADHWEGDAYQTASSALQGLREEFDATAAPLTAVDTELSALAGELAAARGMLLDALDAAKRIPASVSADGTEITYTGDDARPGMRVTIRRRVRKVFDAIDDALDKADRADKAAALALARLVPGYDPTTLKAGNVPEIPPPGTDPKRVNAWWDSLTPAQQQYLIHHDPDRIGRLDGVPVMYRDQANRARLAREHERAETRKRQIATRLRELEVTLRDGSTSEATRANSEVERLRREEELIDRNLKGISTIEKRLYDSPKLPRAYLLGFEPGTPHDRGNDGVADDDGRVIIAIGNPDTADHVATFVPGTGAGLDSIHGSIGHADAMASEATDKAAGEDVAVVVWLDYDAPDEPVANAPADQYADAATDDLRRFQDGLRATHEGERSHNTVIGTATAPPSSATPRSRTPTTTAAPTASTPTSWSSWAAPGSAWPPRPSSASTPTTCGRPARTTTSSAGCPTAGSATTRPTPTSAARPSTATPGRPR